jgi:hypothetical protein
MSPFDRARRDFVQRLAALGGPASAFFALVTTPFDATQSVQTKVATAHARRRALLFCGEAQVSHTP